MAGVESRVPPCIFSIYGGLRPSMVIHITGKTLESARRFSVNLQHGTDQVPAPDIALRIDVCFVTSKVVRNSRFNGVWGEEESYITEFPFQPNERFSIVITIMVDRFHIVINSRHMIQFPHRLCDVRRMDTVYIDQDADIRWIRWVGD